MEWNEIGRPRECKWTTRAQWERMGGKKKMQPKTSSKDRLEVVIFFLFNLGFFACRLLNQSKNIDSTHRSVDSPFWPALITALVSASDAWCRDGDVLAVLRLLRQLNWADFHGVSCSPSMGFHLDDNSNKVRKRIENRKSFFIHNLMLDWDSHISHAI